LMNETCRATTVFMNTSVIKKGRKDHWIGECLPSKKDVERIFGHILA